MLLCFVAGFGLFAASLRYSWYTVSEQEISELSRRLADKPRDERWNAWYEETEKLETPRKSQHDLGIGLISLASVLDLLYIAFRFPLIQARTPKKKWTFILIYLLALASQIPAAVYYLGHRQSRYEYPTWGDSIGIGLSETLMTSVFFAIFGTLFFLVLLWKASFPTHLFVWSRSQPIASSIITLIFGLLGVACLISLPYSVMDGSIGGVIMSAVMLYLFMSIRAGMIQYQLLKRRNSEHVPPAGRGVPPRP